MARIALDAMGGDFAPQATVAGALLALSELDPEHSIQLVGRTAVINDQLDTLLKGGEYAALQPHRDRIAIVEAPDVIEMTDKPGAAVRGKPNSSMIGPNISKMSMNGYAIQAAAPPFNFKNNSRFAIRLSQRPRCQRTRCVFSVLRSSGTSVQQMGSGTKWIR